MGEKGTKSESGTVEKRTVLRLEPVTYKVTLVYMGHDRIAHDPANYRCKYELQRDTTLINTFPNIIANQVRQAETDAAAVAAATPSAAGGDFRNPPADQVFRLMITDNHALRAADSGFLGRPAGDTNSKTDSYTARGWMKDVTPAVPFRVVVRKFIGATQVDYDKSFRAVVEIKDPPEEFAQNDGLRRTFLEGFFNTHNRTNATPSPGDDNAQTEFDGKRQATGAGAGVKATDVLKTIPYASPPAADAPPTQANHNTFASLGNATAEGAMNARFDLTAQNDPAGKRVGVADFAFVPPPCGGDNYRFLITIVDGSKDIRDTQENGLDVVVKDDADQVIPKPRGYVTGRFVIWKRTDFRLVVLVNNTISTDIDWAAQATMYAKYFLEVPTPPAANFQNLTLAAWRAALRNEFDPAGTDARFDNDANFTPAIYNTGLFPPFLNPTATRANVDNITRALVRAGCGAIVPAVNPTPDVDTVQDNQPGMFMMFFKRAPTTVVGVYLGDRTFWFAQGSSLAETTNFVAHEFGHGLYLRHGHTNYPAAQYTDTGGTVTPIRLADGTRNNQIPDHDQADAFDCLMSYTGPVATDPCAVCGLTIRMYDRVELQRRAHHGDQIMNGLTPATIVRVTVAGTADQLNETIPALSPGLPSIDVMCVGPPRQFIDISNPPPPGFTGRANITAVAGNNWTAAPAGRVNLTVGADRVTVQRVAAGAVTLTYTNGAINASANLTVT